MQIASVNLSFFIPPESKNVQEQMDAALRATKSSNCLLAHFQSVAHILHAVALSFFNSIKYFAHSMVQTCHHIAQRSASQALHALVHGFSLISQSLLFPLISVGLIACAFFAPKNTFALFSCPKEIGSLESLDSREFASALSAEIEYSEEFVSLPNLNAGWLQENVPIEILSHSFSYLPWEDINRSRLSCHFFKDASDLLKIPKLTQEESAREKWSFYDVEKLVHRWGKDQTSFAQSAPNFFSLLQSNMLVKAMLLDLFKKIKLLELRHSSASSTVDFLKNLPIEIPISLEVGFFELRPLDLLETKLRYVSSNLANQIEQFHSPGSLGFNANISNKFFAFFPQYPRLSRIDINNLVLNTESVSLLLPHSAKIKELQVFDICTLSDLELENFFTHLTELQTLSFTRAFSVDIGSDDRIDYFQSNRVIRALIQRCTQLKTLQFHFCAPAEDVFKSVSGHATLETLRLTFDSKISEVLFDDLCQFISHCPRLNQLDLDFKKVNQNLEALTHFLQKNPPLRQLRLNYDLPLRQSATDGELSFKIENAFTQCLNACPPLERLEIFFATGGETSNHLVKIDSDIDWPVFSKLKDVHLEFPNSSKTIFDDGFIFNIAKGFPNLSSLSLHTEICKITDEGINALTKFCKTLSCFKLLYRGHAAPDRISYESVRSLIRETKMPIFDITHPTIRNLLQAEFPNLPFLS